MIDAFLILTPFLLLAVIALLGFVGCGELQAATDTSAPKLPSLKADPDQVGAGGTSHLDWEAGSKAQSASIDQGIGQVYTFGAKNPDNTSGKQAVTPKVTTIYTLSATDFSGALIAVPGAGNVATVTVSAPQVGTLSPPSGPTTGGISVNIKGQNFGNPVTVTFGIVPSPMVSWFDGGSIVAVTPPQASGVVNVTVTNSDGQSATLLNSFSYTPPISGAVTHLQSVLKGPVFGTVISASLPPFPGTGKLIVVTVQWGGAATVTLSSAPVVMFTAIEVDSLNPQQVATFAAQNVSGAITVTATLSAASTTEVNLLVSAYDNVAPGSIPDHAGKTQGTGTALSLPFSTAGLTAGDLIYAIAVARNNGAVLAGSLSAGTVPPMVAESGQGSYLLLEDHSVTAADLASPNISVTAVDTTGNATSLGYLFAMRITHA